MNVYLSGVTVFGSDDCVEYYDKIENIARSENKDCVIINPCSFKTELESVCHPQLIDYIEMSIISISKCDKIYIGKNWMDSDISRIERIVADILKKEIVYVDVW